METRNTEMRGSLREEERRRREEVLTQSLQQQVDELRHALREQATRQQRLEEQVRQSEAHVGQMRVDLDEARQDAGRLAQLRQLDEQRLRQLLTELQARVEEPLRPLRNLQAQVNDLADHQRQSREQTGQEQRQIEAVRLQIDAVRGDTVRALDAARGVREGIDTLQQGQANVAREVQKLGDQGRLIEQEVRRRIATVEQQVENLTGRIAEVASHRPQLEEAIKQTREDMRIFQPQIDALVGQAKGHEGQMARVQSQAEERDTIMRERVEAVRGELAAQIATLVSAFDETVEGIYSRIAEWEEEQRAVGGRLSDVSVELSALYQVDQGLAEAIRRGEERLVRAHLDQAQAAWEALMERRAKENEEP